MSDFLANAQNASLHGTWRRCPETRAHYSHTYVRDGFNAHCAGGPQERPANLPDHLRALADDHELLWTVARFAIEEELIDWRDNRRFMLRNNGFVIKEKDGTSSNVIRFGPEVGVRIALRAIADHLEADDA